MGAALQSTMSSQLEQLRASTVVVADTGDIDLIAKYKPTDATTNPSLIYAAAQMPQYRGLIDDAVSYAKSRSSGSNAKELMPLIMDKLFVNFGCEILKHIPGYCSTEVDARLSFDTQGSIDKGRELVRLYEEQGYGKDRVLIKLAS